MKRFQEFLNFAAPNAEHPKPATDVVGGEIVFALCQLRNVRVRLLFPCTGDRTKIIDTDGIGGVDEDGVMQPSGVEWLWQEMQTVNNLSLNQADMTERRLGMEVKEVWTEPSHVEPIGARQRAVKSSADLYCGWSAEGQRVLRAVIDQLGEPGILRKGRNSAGVRWSGITREYKERTKGWGEPERSEKAVKACWQHMHGQETAAQKSNAKVTAERKRKREEEEEKEVRPVKRTPMRREQLVDEDEE